MKTKSRRGVTLVELMAVLALLAIIGATVGSAVYTAGKQYSDIMTLDQAKTAVDTMQLQMVARLRYVSGPVSTEGAGSNRIYSADGVFLLKHGDADPVDLFAEMPGIYAGLYYELSCTNVENNSVRFHISVRKKQSGDIKYETDFTLHFLNATVGGGANGVMLGYDDVKK